MRVNGRDKRWGGEVVVTRRHTAGALSSFQKVTGDYSQPQKLCRSVAQQPEAVGEGDAS